MEKKQLKRNWSESEYTKLIRIKSEDHFYIMSSRRGLQSAAGFLHKIIKKYREYENE